MNVKYKLLSECVANKEVDFTYIPTAENIADALIKSLLDSEFDTKLLSVSKHIRLLSNDRTKSNYAESGGIPTRD